MSKGAKPKDVFDVERIRQIIQLMEEHDLGEVDLQQGDEKIRLARASAAPVISPVAAAPVAAPAAATPPAGEAKPDLHAGTQTVNAPMVGTFYTKPNPDAPPFVKVGDRVGPETTVCIVEAMKVFNEIPAEMSGEVVEVLVADGSPVDFGKPLIRIRTE
ncbi:MAG: acetyl-CoA carboxylase biotin carboxyl carrier protein [Planctomycetota bacterium]